MNLVQDLQYFFVVKDVKKGEIHVEQKKDQQEKDPGGSIVLTLGQKKEKL